MHKKLFLLISSISLYALPETPALQTVATAGSIPRILHTLEVEVSAGELLDKLTILQIKAERIQDPNKLMNIQTELAAIGQTIERYIVENSQLNNLIAQLKIVNESLWDIEDAIRDKEARQEFDQAFITLARSVYFTNDKRGDIKREINMLLGSHLMEEKQYTHYEQK